VEAEAEVAEVEAVAEVAEVEAVAEAVVVVAVAEAEEAGVAVAVAVEAVGPHSPR
jgi:hypothetical protein